MVKMHADEVEIDERLVHGLLAAQFPDLASLPLRRVEPAGTDHAIFRLGGELSVRLARVDGPTEPGGTEVSWLPRLAARLPLRVPLPVAQGRPGDDYPWYWQIRTWVTGETVPVETLEPHEVASDLRKLIEALWEIDGRGGPLGRGVPLAQRDEEFRHWWARFDGPAELVDLWERALSAPPWAAAPVWHHGDLDARNWLVSDRRISGVIDWRTMGVGDPACDLMVAWKLHSATARDALRNEMPADAATWERARGWVVSQAVAILAYYTPETNPTLCHEAESWLDLVLSELPDGSDR